jgi:hypothetical protein
LAATQVVGKSPSGYGYGSNGYLVGFRGPQAGDLSYTDYSDADIGPMGPQAGDYWCRYCLVGLQMILMEQKEPLALTQVIQELPVAE